MPFLHPERRLRGDGKLDDFDDELRELKNAEVGAVVSLLNIPSDSKIYVAAGFEFICMPVDDGRPPTIEQVREFVLFVDRCFSSGKSVAVHCEAGCGRTGTMIGAYLIAKGDSPVEAVQRVRASEPSAIETRAQIEFLFKLPAALRSGAYPSNQPDS